MVSADTLAAPDQRVSAANAGGYRVPAMDTPAINQPTKNHTRFCASATTITATTPSNEPAVINARGPTRSRRLPTGTPTPAETTSADENAAVVVTRDQPVSAVIRPASTGKA